MILGLLLAVLPLLGAVPAGQTAGPEVVHAPEEKESVQHVRILPSALATVWLVAGYDGTANVPAPSGAPGSSPQMGPASAFGLDLGGGLLFRVVGPVYFGALLDYALTGPNALLVAGAAGLIVADFTFTGGFGYASASEGGLGVLLGVDYELTRGVKVRAQGSWRQSSYTTGTAGLAQEPLTDHRHTVWSLLGGLSLSL